ncbi:MAG: OmpH family outer membrane protein [Polaribacter sp.]|uniref:OmpH family outer membrane protein n=1 Tax=Polaribacter sp. TaxID=1920175 RepID=UPI002F350088
MKNLKTLLLIAVFTLGVAGIANAQKVGHIDFEKLVAEMPQTKALKLDIEKLGKTYQDEIKGMAKKLDAKRKKYIAESEAQTKDTNDQRALELQKEGATYEKTRQFAYQDMQKQQNEKLSPIIEKAEKAVQAVAATKGLLYIMDSSKGKGLLVSKGEDIFNAVKAKLGF